MGDTNAQGPTIGDLDRSGFGAVLVAEFDGAKSGFMVVASTAFRGAPGGYIDESGSLALVDVPGGFRYRYVRRPLLWHCNLAIPRSYCSILFRACSAYGNRNVHCCLSDCVPGGAQDIDQEWEGAVGDLYCAGMLRCNWPGNDVADTTPCGSKGGTE